ncbi:hypothetical protein Pmar_PMAR009704 [Perkinsus marinus ATCC 50983]|uniref:ApaG domain-containing protein n=1 Tax=Perkinsus marinus (strain ATCC 50983 / TXsc) TaxID=423536 RepID=C5L214_PERM5|nr:hypothetical protein Pmar_PMAR009704 [Perkinsus marinus ATCC 50983]EER09207.1 hypothetical protein Pmar_PMAR009704 [Perkinsus marinus ATCC 50983]|eukprot:XP_002777391.1 hypothetical protein Pmar_PMAR009704 [Perkinsus marinus ATCC 50983]
MTELSKRGAWSIRRSLTVMLLRQMRRSGKIVNLTDGRQLLETNYPCQIDFWGRGYSMATNVVRVSELAYTAEKALKFHVVSKSFPDGCNPDSLPARVSGLSIARLKNRLLRPLLCENDNKVVVAPREEEDSLFETVKYVSEQSVLNASNFQRVDPQAGIMIRVATGYCQDAAQPADPSQRSYVYTYRITVHNLHQNKSYRILARNYTFRDADGHVFANINPGSEESMGVVGLTPLLSPGESFTFHSGVRIPTTETGTFTGSLEIGTEKKKVESTVETESDSNHSSTMDVKRERLDVRYRKYKDEAEDTFFVALPDVAFRPAAVAVKLQDNFDRFRYFAERAEHLSALGHTDETADDDYPETTRRRPHKRGDAGDSKEGGPTG